MNDGQPTQPLTDAELETIRHDVESNTPAYASVTRAILLAEVDRLRAENDGYRAAICFEATCTGCAGLLDQMVRLEAENAAARELHQPVTVDWSASPKCKASHGPGWVNWPCSDAKALGMDQSGEGQTNG